MALGPGSYVVLDVLSTLLTLAVAGGFLAVARLTRQGLHVVMAIGFSLVGLGFLFVAASHFNGGAGAEASEAARVIGLLSGSVTILLSYATHHAGGRRPHYAAVTLGALGGTLALAAALWFVPPVGRLALGPRALAAAYSTMAAAYLGCMLLSGHGWHRRPTWGRAMVPLGFLAWTFSAYTWVLVSLGAGETFLPAAYAWRFAALLLMLGAMARRPRPAPPPLEGRGDGDAAA